MLETMRRSPEIINPEIISHGQKEFEKELPEFIKEIVKVDPKENKRKKWREIVSAIGALIFLCNVAWKEKEKIFDAGVKLFRGPVVSEILDQQFAKRYKMPESLSDRGVRLDSRGESEPAINLGGLYLGFPTEDTEKYDNFSKLTDDREKINVTNPYLENLIKPKLVYLKKPENQAKFSQIVSERTRIYLDARDQGEGFNEIKDRRKKAFDEGKVDSFVELVTFIVKSNFKYDPTTESWHDSSGEKFSFKIGNTNPISAMLSATGSPIDKFLENKKGYCSHFAEAICYVSEEVKRQFPGKFDNIYFTTFTSAYKFHTWNAWFLVRSNQEVEMGARNYNEDENPTYDLLKTLYDRKVISESRFFELCGDYFSNYEANTEENDDLDGFVEFALHKKSSESLAAVEKIIIGNVNTNFQNSYMYSIEEQKQLGKIDQYTNINNLQEKILRARDESINNLFILHLKKYNQITGTNLLHKHPFIFPQTPIKSPQEIKSFITDKSREIQSENENDILDSKNIVLAGLVEEYIYSILNLMEETDSLETRNILKQELENNAVLLLEAYNARLDQIAEKGITRERDFYDFINNSLDDLFDIKNQAQDKVNREKINQLIIKTIEKWEKNIDHTYHGKYSLSKSEYQKEFIEKILEVITKAEEYNSKSEQTDNNPIGKLLETYRTKYQLLLEKMQNLPE